jgi:hypothetical protein
VFGVLVKHSNVCCEKFCTSDSKMYAVKNFVKKVETS